MSNFSFPEILSRHNEYLKNLSETETKVSIPELKEFITSALNSSKDIEFEEDREQLGFILRFWGSYISLRGERFPNINIDHSNFRPTEVKVRAFQTSEIETNVVVSQPLFSRSESKRNYTILGSQKSVAKSGAFSRRQSHIYRRLGKARMNTGKTVMVISPKPQYRVNMRGKLEALGYRVVEAKNKQECIAEIQELGPNQIHSIVYDPSISNSRGRGFVVKDKTAQFRVNIEGTLMKSFGRVINIYEIE